MNYFFFFFHYAGWRASDNPEFVKFLYPQELVGLSDVSYTLALIARTDLMQMLLVFFLGVITWTTAPNGSPDSALTDLACDSDLACGPGKFFCWHVFNLYEQIWFWGYGAAAAAERWNSNNANCFWGQHFYLAFTAILWSSCHMGSSRSPSDGKGVHDQVAFWSSQPFRQIEQMS